MHFDRSSLLEAIAHYKTNYPAEEAFIPSFVALLSDANAFHRNHLPGHITASAWIVDESKGLVLLTHHAKLNKWLQPGGHADGDENVFAVALREAREETGLTTLTPLLYAIFDIDIHTIPPRKEFPEHLHFDVRFLFQADTTAALTITSESHDLKWIPVTSLASCTSDNDSMLRMADKVTTLFASDQ